MNPLAGLPARFFEQSPRRLARALIGRALVHDSPDGRCMGLIVETEAYDESDPASHSFGGPTVRNRSMFGPPGHAYVYRSYGVHWCLNVVACPAGRGAAVLLRALEPRIGIELMHQRRAGGDPGSVPTRDLARGPGRLCQAMGITDAHDGLEFGEGGLWLGHGEPPAARDVVCTPRVGITKAAHRRWRYCLAASPFVSRGVVTANRRA